MTDCPKLGHTTLYVYNLPAFKGARKKTFLAGIPLRRWGV